jgi:hypothetical protein
VSHRIPPDRVAHETVDGEVVILDHRSGLYFSLTGAGADIWALIDAGVEADAIVAALTARYLVEEGAARVAVARLLTQLESDGLVEPCAEPARPAPPVDGPARPWLEPLFERFTELQTLLVLDPIHDVDETGWPRIQQRA